MADIMYIQIKLSIFQYFMHFICGIEKFIFLNVNNWQWTVFCLFFEARFVISSDSLDLQSFRCFMH